MVPDSDPRFRYCVYQTEECPETKRWHNQGYIEFNAPVTYNVVKGLLGDPTCHVEARKGTRSQARAYAMKEETRVAGPTEWGTWTPEENERQREDLVDARLKIQKHKSWFNVVNDPELVRVIAKYGRWAREVFESRPINQPAPEIALYEWQTDVLSMLTEPVEKRRIIWIYSHESGTGKTTLYDYVSTRMNTLPGGDYANTVYAYDGHDCIWFDLTRHQTDEHIPYHALEKLSNQTTHLSTKYVTVRKYISAHIVVTANVPPNTSKIPDRCKVILAKKDEMLTDSQ